MKKVYLLVSGLLLTVGAVNAQTTDSQRAANVRFAPFMKGDVVNRTGLMDDREADDILWEDDFSDTSHWVAAGPSGDYTLNGWSIGETTLGWLFGTDEDMGTEGNFARFVNGDPREEPDPTLGLPVADGPFTLTFHESIDLTGVPAPHLEFEQYGARFVTLHAVQVRAGGGDWVTVGNNNDIPPLTIDGGDRFPKPQARRYNITTAIADDPSEVEVRLLWDGALNGADMNYIEYAWFVDNIKIVEGHTYDSDIQYASFRAGLGSSYETGLEYYMIPEEQAVEMDITFVAETINQGGSTFEGLYLDARVEKDASEVFAGTSDPNDLPPTERDSVGTTTSLTPDGQGTYEVTWKFMGDGDDTYPYNDEITEAFEVTDFVYGRDNGIETNAFTNWAGNAGQSFRAGNTMDIFADAVIGAIDVKINDAEGNVGQPIFGQIEIYSEDEGEWVYYAQTDDHDITEAENGGWIRLFFDEEVNVSAGDVILVMAGHFGSDVGFGLAQSVDHGVLGYTASERASLADPRAVMVRAVTKSFIGLEEETATNFSVGQNTPNPFGENSIINYELNEAANVSVEFVDISGKVVKSVNNGTQTAGAYTLNIDANDFAEGVYFYTFTVGAEKITKRMVITK